MAPDLKRLRMASTGSTSSMGMGWAAVLNSSKPRSVQSFLGLVVDQRGIFLEDLVIGGAAGLSAACGWSAG